MGQQFMAIVNTFRNGCALLLLGLSVTAAHGGDAPPSAITPLDTRLTPAQAGEDFELAIAAVEAALPRITWFQTAQQWQDATRAARQAMTEVRDSQSLFRVLRPLLSRIGEGHLALRRSTAMIQLDRQSAGWLPVDLHWTDESVRIIAGYGEAAGIPVGTRLLAIDGQATRALVPELMSALGHDGHIRNGAMREAEGAGYARVRYWMRGAQADYRLRLQYASGAIEERRVAGVAAAIRPVRSTPEASPVATLQWLDRETALLRVPTFSNRRYREAGADYRKVMQQLFHTLQARGTRQLVLDLRDNGGGSESNENLLYAYLVKAPLRKYAVVEARAAALSITDASGRRYATEVYDDAELRLQHRLPDGRLARRNLRPEGLMSHWSAMSPVFNGRLVVLIGGNTFSGAAELASMLHHARRGVFVGEEAGGSNAGNTSGYSWEIALPNSGMQLDVPLLRFEFAWQTPPHGRGVLPHCHVSPDLPGRAAPDAALQRALDLLSRPWVSGQMPACSDRAS
jgi:C-terminal processing protease CtpA/Prc